MKSIFKKWSLIAPAVISSLAVVVTTFVAQTSSELCSIWWFGQPKVPKTLLKRD